MIKGEKQMTKKWYSEAIKKHEKIIKIHKRILNDLDEVMKK
jgi:hypothetical protein